MKKSQFPLLVNENIAGYNEAVQDFERKVFPYIATIKDLYNGLQLSEPFNDSVYRDIIYHRAESLIKAIDDKIKGMAPTIGINHNQSVIEARKSVAVILSQIHIQTTLLQEGFGRTHFKGRCFDLKSVINIDTSPEISAEAREKALESFRTYIQNEAEQETYDLLHNFGITYDKFIQELKSKGYQNGGAGISESCLSDFFNELEDNTLQVREDAVQFIRGLSAN